MNLFVSYPTPFSLLIQCRDRTETLTPVRAMCVASKGKSLHIFSYITWKLTLLFDKCRSQTLSPVEEYEASSEYSLKARPSFTLRRPIDNSNHDATMLLPTKEAFRTDPEQPDDVPDTVDEDVLSDEAYSSDGYRHQAQDYTLPNNRPSTSGAVLNASSTSRRQPIATRLIRDLPRRPRSVVDRLQIEISDMRRQILESASIANRFTNHLAEARAETSRIQDSIRVVERILDYESRRREEAEKAIIEQASLRFSLQRDLELLQKELWPNKST